MTTQLKTVAVTGSSGYIGAKLLEHLEEEPGINRVVAFDVRSVPAPIHNIAAFRRDVATPIDEELQQYRVDTLVHLACSREDGTDGSQQNREMLRSVLASCVRAGVGHIIYLSSHTIYGARASNPLPISEDSPLNPHPAFQYANDHQRAELELAEFSQASTDTQLTILRSCPVLGTTASMPPLRGLYFPGALVSLDYNPPLQFVYDDDLARVILQVIAGEIAGVFNVAADGVVFLRELAELLALKQTWLPSPLARPLNRLTTKNSVIGDPGLSRWPVLMSAGKLHRATGYRFRHTGMDAVKAFANSNDEVQWRLRKKIEIL